MVLVAIALAGAWSVTAEGPQREAAAAQAPPVPLAIASVAADGGLTAGDAGWHAARLAVGSYLLEFPAETTVALRTWTSVASVTSRPISATAWTVTFTVDGQPVDSAFTFLASPLG